MLRKKLEKERRKPAIKISITGSFGGKMICGGLKAIAPNSKA
jgi:hypothetical protein